MSYEYFKIKKTKNIYFIIHLLVDSAGPASNIEWVWIRLFDERAPRPLKFGTWGLRAGFWFVAVSVVSWVLALKNY